MGKNNFQQILIAILSDTLNCRVENSAIKEQITNENILPVCKLAQKHNLAHIVSNFIYVNKIQIDDKIKAKLQHEEFISVFKYEQINYATNEICNIFQKENIAHIKLKGSVIRKYYPSENMRTSCDIDILIKPEDIDRAVEVLKINGYSYIKKGYHDILLCSPNSVNVELHFNLLENNVNLDTVLRDAWQNTQLLNGCQYEFTNEFFVFHMFAHMAYHFLNGGCGVRSLMDIWVMEHKMGLTYSCAVNLLKKAGIYKFAVEMTNIANFCFDGKKIKISNEVLRFIINGGIYGSRINNIAVHKSKINSTFVYVIKRLFLPCNLMEITYPILKKAPYLLPFYWIIRWIKGIKKGKTKKLSSEIECAKKISKETVNETKKIRSRLGL
ncbi:MAG: hypothetical protein E7365_00525 [Clostridiales bacterium]|nr:hypothetical protein [Clostridiales bacterium]